MDHVEFRRKLLARCLEIVNDTELNLKGAMDEAQKAANDYGPPKDRYDSFRTQLLRKRDMYAQQLAKISEQRHLVENISPDTIHHRIEFGAIVITSDQNVIVGTGIGKIELEGQTWYCISAAVPLYKAMDGKRAGDEFVFNGKKISILDVF